MKRLSVVLIILGMLTGMVGCGLTSKGIHIVEYNDSRGEVRGIMRIARRDRFQFAYPENVAGVPDMIAVDDAGNILTDVEWALDDPTLGTIGPGPGRPPSVREFVPARAGQTTVTAWRGEESDTAQIIVFPCIMLRQLEGFDFSANTTTSNRDTADIWFPDYRKVEFLEGFWKSPLLGLYEELDAMTGTEGEIGGPGTFTADGPVTFLVKSREGDIYGAVINPAALKVCYRLIIPAPEP